MNDQSDQPAPGTPAEAADSAAPSHTPLPGAEAQKSGEPVRESEERYRTLFACAPDGILISNAEGRCLDANASLCQMLGYRPEELIGRLASDIVVNDRLHAEGPAASALAGPSGHHQTWEFRRRDASLFIGEVTTATMPD